MSHALNIRIASPCSADWNQMAGDDRSRYCGQCRLNVYNLSAMSPEEAMNLVVGREGSLCVRFYQRPDGTLLTKDCPVGLRKIMRRLARVAGVAFAALVNLVPAVAQAAKDRPSAAAQAESGLDLVVLDQLGAVCHGATVELLKNGKQAGSLLTTDNDGELHLSHLSPDVYTLKISYSTFEPYQKIVTLKSGVRLRLTATLQSAPLQGAVVEVSTEPIPVIQSPTPLLEPVPVPKSKPDGH